MRRIACLVVTGFMVLGFIPLSWAAPVKPAKVSEASEGKAAPQAQKAAEPVKLAAPVAMKEKAANGVKVDSAVISAIEGLSRQDASVALRVYYLAIDGYQMLNEPEKTLEMLELAAKAFPKQSDIATRMVSAYQQVGQNDKAIGLIQQLVKTNPDNMAYHQMLANSYMIKGDKAGALAAYKDLAESHSSDPEAQVQCALMLQTNGKPEEAIRYFDAAIKLRPQEGRYMQQLGQAYAMSKKYDEAKKIYEKILSSSKEAWQVRDAQQQLLSIAIQQKSLGSFIAEAEASLKKEPANINTYWRLVDAYAVDNKSVEVLAVLERAIKQFPDNSEVRSRLVWAYQGQGKADKAIDILKEMIAQNPKDMGLKMQYAQAQTQAGKNQEAITTFEQLAAADSKNPIYKEQIAEIYARTNQKDKAIREYEGLLRGTNEDWRKSSYNMRIEQLKHEGKQQVVTPPPAAKR